MENRHRPRARTLLAAVLLLLAAGWYVPQFFSAERYRRSVQQGIERALGREARFGAISFHLLPRPGFTLENVVIGEDPAFGAEPFARVDHMDADFRLQSLLPWRLDILRLSLDRPSFNLVRNDAGQWNLESFLGRERAALPKAANGRLTSFQVTASDARINFKLADEKQPFALSEVDARLEFDQARQDVRFQLTGSPVRTDLLLPSPGQVELEGEWKSGTDPAGSLNATLSTRGALVYDWIPILTGRNPEIYGLADANARLTGSPLRLSAEGSIRLTQLHRWDQPPPSGASNSEIFFRGQYDRPHARLLLDSVEASFADSHLHLTGSVEQLRTLPVLDLVMAIERSRLEDFQSLASRFVPRLGAWSTTGRVDALMTIQGPWADRRYGGFVDIRDARLTTPAGTYPLSEITLRINQTGVQLAPVKVSLAPRVDLLAEGRIERAPLPAMRVLRHHSAKPSLPGPPQYFLTLGAKSVPLRDLMRFARGVEIPVAATVDARGDASVSFSLSGSAWPIARPSVSARLDLHAARLLIPGLTEPLNIPRAHIQYQDGTTVVTPLVVVLGTSVFTGRLDHTGDRTRPWSFDLHANALRLEQGALWFDALGNREPLALLARLPGLASLVERRSAATSLFSALRAQGQFATSKLTYRALTLGDFRAGVEIGDRVVRVSGATFRTGGGKGTGKVVLDLTQSPARIIADTSVVDVRLQPLVVFLPTALRKAHGTFSAVGHFMTLGLSRQEIASNLQGQAEVSLKGVNFGDFDPLGAMARAANQRYLEPVRNDAILRSARLNLGVDDRRVTVTTPAPFLLSGSKMKLEGTYAFDGTTRVNILADLRSSARQAALEGEALPGDQRLHVRLAGPLNKLAPEPVLELSRAVPAKP